MVIKKLYTMNSILKTVIPVYLLNIFLCYYSMSQIYGQQLIHDKEDKPSIKGLSYIGKDSIQVRKPTSSEIYSEIETIRDLGLKQLSEENTITKKFNEELKDRDIKVTSYYQTKKLISIVYRVYDSNGKRV